MINHLIRKTAVSLLAIIALSVSTQVMARDTSDLYGTVSGMVGTDYTIAVTDPRTGKTLSRNLDASGSYRFADMTPGVYDVTVYQAGEAVTSNPVKVSLGQNIAANFDVGQVASGLEEVVVTGSAVRLAVDVTSTDSGLVLGEFDIDNMPVARNPTAVALLAPGVVLGDTGFGNTASMGGASVAENVCVINGLEVTNTRQGLGCGSVPFEFYKEFQVKTGGYSAEFGRATGGLLNAVTKSGGNEWEFFASAIWQPNSLLESGQVSRADGNTGPIFRDTRNDERESREVAFSASGPIIKDRLFIYALINPRDTELKYGYEGPVTADQYVADKEYRVRTSDGADNLFWGIKLDWIIMDGHELGYFGYSDRNDAEELVYSYDPETETIGAESTGGFLRKRGGEAHSIRYIGHFTDRFTVSAMAGQIETEYTTDPLNLDCPTVNDNRSNPNPAAVSCGPGGSIGANNDKNTQYRLDFGYDIGNHQLKAGIDQQDRESTRITVPVAGHSYVYDTLAPNGTIQGDQGALFTNTTGADLDYVQDRIFEGGGGFDSDLTAYYIEDNWQVLDNLMLTIGLRQDNFKSTGTTGKVLSDFSTDIAPRLGFSWDVMGDGDSKIYATYGQYYLPMANNTIYRAASGVSDVTTFYTFTGIDPTTGAPVGATPVNGTVANSSFVSSVSTIPEKDIFQAQEADPFRRDEFIVGYQTAVTDELTVGIRGIYREVASALDDYCGAYAWPYCVMLNPGDTSSWYADGFYWDGENLEIDWDLFDGSPDPGSLRTFSSETIALPKANNEYKAVQIELNHVSDRARWDMIYTWSQSEGNFEGAVKSDIDQADAGITQDFDFPALMDGSQGYQPNDRRHVLKLFGSYDFTDAFTMGFNVLLQSGRPLSSFGRGYPDHHPDIYGSYGDTFYLYTNQCPDSNGNGECDQEEKIYNRTPRGSAGRTSWTFNLDLSARYAFDLGGVNMSAFVNVFNILNIQEETILNEHYERTEGTKNQFYGAAYAWQPPRMVTFGIEARF
jgi:hypothetical protein